MDINKEKKSLLILHSAMCLGVVLLLLALYFFIGSRQIKAINFDFDFLSAIALLIGILNILLSNFIFRRRVAELGTDQLTDETIIGFRGAYIVKWALLESACLINILVYFFFGENSLLLIMAAVLILLLFVSKPRFY